MDVWLLLAAAGSGYLARYWHNAQKTKGAASEEAEPCSEGNFSSSLSHTNQHNSMPAARGKFRHFSPPNRRQSGNLLGSRRNHDWCPSSRHGVKGHHAAERSAMGNLTETGAELGDGLDGPCNPSKLEQAYQLDKGRGADEGEVGTRRRREDNCEASIIYLGDKIGNANSVSKDGATAGSQKVSMHGNDTKEALEECGLPEEKVTDRPLSTKRSNENRKDESLKYRELFQDGFTGKRMKDAIDKAYNVEEQLFFDGNFMPGLWDNESPMDLDVIDNFLQQGGEGRNTGNGSRRVKTLSRSGRNSGSMKKRKSHTNALYPLDCCVSAQLCEEKENKSQTDVLSSIFSFTASSQGHELVRSTKVDGVTKDETRADVGVASLPPTVTVLGLPPLPKQQNGMSYLAEMGKIKRSTSRKNSQAESVSFAPRGCQRIELLKSMNDSRGHCDNSDIRQVAQFPQAATALDAPVKEVGTIQEITGYPLEGHLFNFGVGVGMMFTIISNRTEVKKLAELVKETEGLVNDLDYELESEDGVTFNMTRWESDAAREKSQAATGTNLKRVKSSNQLVSSLRISFAKGYESKLQTMQSEDMAKLEAELEEELERMELNLGDQSAPKHHRMFSGLSEVDADLIANVVVGELTVKGLPNEVEVEPQEDGTKSSHEEFHLGDYAVSPWELEMRLHEVIQARQEERISELEAEVNSLCSKLQEKDEELNWWKDYVFHLSEPPAISSDAGVGDHLTSKLQRTNYRSTEKTAFISDLASQQFADDNCLDFKTDCNFSNVLTNSSEVPNNESLKNIPVFISLAGDALAAYNEAYDEFLKVGSNSELHTNPSSTGQGKDTKSSFMDNYCINEVCVPMKDQQAYGDNFLQASISNQVDMDILSLARGFHNGHDPEVVMNASAKPLKLSKTEFKDSGFTSDIQENPQSKGKHPDPEQLLASSKLMDMLDDTTNDTSGSTPCSIKFMDTSTSGACQSDYQESGCGGSHLETCAHADNGICFSCNQTILNHAGANTPVSCSQTDPHSFQLVSMQSSECRGTGTALNKHRYGEAGANPRDISREGRVMGKVENSAIEDSSYASDSEEILGDLLIKQIVEKTRKGSPIVHEAQTVLASLERNEASLGSSFFYDWINSKDVMAVESISKGEESRPSCVHSLALKKEASDSLHKFNEILGPEESLNLSHASLYSTEVDLDSKQPLTSPGKSFTKRAHQSREARNVTQCYLDRLHCGLEESSKGFESGHLHWSAQKINGLDFSTEGREMIIRARQDAAYGTSNNDRQTASTHQTGQPSGIGRDQR